MKQAKNDDRFIKVPDGAHGPWRSEHGWYCTETEPNIRIEGSAWVSGNARVYGNAWVYGDAWVSGEAQVYGNARVSGGKLIGTALSVPLIRWTLSLCQPGTVEIGCQTHTIDAWLDESNPDGIPWEDECTPEEKAVVIATIKAIAAQEALGNTWEESEA